MTDSGMAKRLFTASPRSPPATLPANMPPSPTSPTPSSLDAIVQFSVVASGSVSDFGQSKIDAIEVSYAIRFALSREQVAVTVTAASVIIQVELKVGTMDDARALESTVNQLTAQDHASVFTSAGLSISIISVGPATTKPAGASPPPSQEDSVSLLVLVVAGAAVACIVIIILLVFATRKYASLFPTHLSAFLFAPPKTATIRTSYLKLPNPAACHTVPPLPPTALVFLAELKRSPSTSFRPTVVAGVAQARRHRYRSPVRSPLLPAEPAAATCSQCVSAWVCGHQKARPKAQSPVEYSRKVGCLLGAANWEARKFEQGQRFVSIATLLHEPWRRSSGVNHASRKPQRAALEHLQRQNKYVV